MVKETNSSKHNHHDEVEGKKNKKQKLRANKVDDSEDHQHKSKSKNAEKSKGKQKKEVLPVTLLSGFLGSGKTTLLKHILESNEHKMKIAVIVNDMAELNIDASLIKEKALEVESGANNSKGHQIVQTKQEVVALQNGCICCTLRTDLVREINRIYELGQFDYCIIESTGIAEPMQVAESFTADVHNHDHESKTIKIADNEEAMLWHIARLDTCVTVIDAREFNTLSTSLETFYHKFRAEVSEEDAQEGDKNIAQLLIEQIEFANVILLNKVELVSSDELQAITTVIETLNPKAKIIPTSYSKVDIAEVVNTKRFNLDEAQQAAGWLQSLQHSDDKIHSEKDEYNISSFVYKARRPFHPNRLYQLIQKLFYLNEEWQRLQEKQRLHELLNIPMSTAEKSSASKFTSSLSRLINGAQQGEADLAHKLGGLLRSKGFCWIAGRDNVIGEWAHAGQLLTISALKPWYCLESEEDLRAVFAEEELQKVKKDFQEPFGDRRQEIVFIGVHLNTALIKACFDACLLNDQEMLEHFTRSVSYIDPLPAWSEEIGVVEDGESWLFQCKLLPRTPREYLINQNSELVLSSLALQYNDTIFSTHEKLSRRSLSSFAVKVWIDHYDENNQRQSTLLGTLRPLTNEQIALSVTLPSTGEKPIALRIEEIYNYHKRKIHELDRILHSSDTNTDSESEDETDSPRVEVHLLGTVNAVTIESEEDDDEEGGNDDEECALHDH